MQKQTVKSKTKSVQKQEMTPVRYNVVREEIRNLSTTWETKQIELMELVYEVHANGYASAYYGYRDFQEWAERELPFGNRKAYYYVRIWEALKRVESVLPREQILALGWSKAKEIAGLLTLENAKEMIEKAEGLSVRQLSDEVKVIKQTIPSEEKAAPKKVKIKFVLEEHDFEVYQDAMRLVKEIVGDVSDAIAITHIVNDWLITQDNALAPMENIVSWIERTYGVTITVQAKEQPTEAQKLVDTVMEKHKNGEGKKIDIEELLNL